MLSSGILGGTLLGRFALLGESKPSKHTSTSPPPPLPPKGIVIVSPSQVPLPGALSHAAGPPAVGGIKQRLSLIHLLQGQQCPESLRTGASCAPRAARALLQLPAERSRLRRLPDSLLPPPPPPRPPRPRSHSAFLTASSKGIKAPFLHRRPFRKCECTFRWERSDSGSSAEFDERTNAEGKCYLRHFIENTSLSSALLCRCQHPRERTVLLAAPPPLSQR